MLTDASVLLLILIYVISAYPRSITTPASHTIDAALSISVIFVPFVPSACIISDAPAVKPSARVFEVLVVVLVVVPVEPSVKRPVVLPAEFPVKLPVNLSVTPAVFPPAMLPAVPFLKLPLAPFILTAAP